MKKLLAMLLAVAMVMSMIPVIASADEATTTPYISKVNMTLNGILNVNFKVDANGASMSDYSVNVTIGNDTTGQEITNYTMDGSLYVYTAKLPAHRLPETLHVTLLNGGTAVGETKEWTVASYLDRLEGNASATEELKALCAKLEDYGTYAAAYDDGLVTDALPDVADSELDDYKHNVTEFDATLKSVAALYIDDACDLLVKFNAEAFTGKKLIIDTVDVTAKVETVGEQAVYRIEELLPQQWKHMYDIQVVDGENTVCHFTYGVMSYIRGQLSESTEAKTGLNNLLKSMYAYSTAAIAYADQTLPDSVISYDPVSEVYTVKGTSDGAQDGFYYDMVSAEPSMRFEIVADMTAAAGDWTASNDNRPSGMGFVLEQNGNRVIFTYPTAWDIGVVVQNGTTGEIDTGKERFDNYESLPFPQKGGNADYPIFTTPNTLYKLKLVYDYGYIYFLYWNGAQWVQLPRDAYFASYMSRDADSLNGNEEVVKESIGVTFDMQQGFTVGVGALLGQDHKGARTVGGTIANVQYTGYSTGEDVNIEYTNTLDEIYLRDTYILKDNGTYYLYGTTNFPTIQCWSSTDKINWKTEGAVYFNPKNGNYNHNTGTGSYEYALWAPEVYKIGDEYVMIATFSENGTSEYDKTNVVLKSNSPTGPFTISHEIDPGDAENYYLDGTLYEENGQKYLIFADQNSSYMMYVKLNDDLTVASGASATEWFKNTIIDGDSWTEKTAAVMDGPEVYTDSSGQKWLLWATFPDGMAAGYDTYTQYATKFTSIGDSMISSNTVTLYTGGGHGMILEDGEQDYLVIHAPNSNPRPKLLPVTLLSDGTLSVWDGQFAGIAQERTQTYQANVTENTTLFVGDSFMDPVWWANFSNDLLGKDALLLGIGSTASEDWYNYYLLDYFQKTDVQPKNIVFSIGNNDIHSDGLSAEVYVASMKSMLSEVNKRQPNSKLYVFSVAYRTNASTNSVVDTANTLLKAWCEETNGIVTFVDITAALGTNQFKDGIHPNNECYTDIYLPALVNAGCELVEMTPAGSAEEYGDKLLGGWLGQMLGVDRGYPNEFNNNATLVDDSEIKAMSDVDPNSALYQDDLYVEIPFLQAMSQYGYNCDGSYLADAFKNTTFGLWHANLWGRTNLQNGIAYPNSGSYLYNQCAEDIDWQIESDFLGMMYPGQPSAAAAKAFELGHIMNYGDGVYGGVFVAAMHAQAYTATSLEQIWTAGIQVIPEGTQFRALLDDVLANYDSGMSFEDNWAAINAKWIPTAMCFAERNSCTIDAKLNAGYVLMALLYASTEEGIYNQIDKATYYAIKCGMDTDCNASTAASVLGNYYGYEAMQKVFNYSLSWNSKFSETSVTLTEATEMNIALMNAVLADNSTPETTITPVAVEQVPNGVYVYLNSMSEPSGKTVYFNGATFRYKNAEAVSYTVDYGDGTVREASDYWLVYTYAEEGTYTIKFTVHDSMGGSHTATLTVCAGFSTEGATTITSLSQITDSSGSYVLGADITNNKTTLSEFSGTLNGNGHTITTSVPLFEALNGATVENLEIGLTGNMTAQGTLASSAANAAITGVTVIGNGYTLTGSENAPVGGLVGTAQYTTFTDCSSSVNVTAVGTGSAGGILGATSADEILLCRCSNEGTVTAADASAGGILGDAKSNKVKLYGCTNSGTVSTSGSYKGAGGIVGEAYWASGTADSVYIGNAGNTVTTNIGTVSGYYAGGIVGYAHDGAYLTVENAVNKGTVTDGSRTAQDTRVGGIVGFANHNNSIVKLNNCSNEGTISGGIVGGILGHAADAAVTITGGSNSGLVTGEEYLGTGGIVGRVDGSAANVTISGATNNGTVKMYDVSGQSRVGGIAGYLYGYGSVAITNCTNAGTVYGGIVGGVVGHGQNGDLTVTGCTNEGPVATTSSNTYVWAGGIAALVQNDTQTAVITGNTNTGYVTAHSGAIAVSQIVAQCDGTNTIENNTASGFDARCANAVEITDWSQITDMWGTYILAADITTNGTTYDFHGRLYGTGHTIRTATTLFGYTNNAQFSVQDLNVVLTADLTANSVLVNTINTNNSTVKVTLKNVHLSAENGAKLTNSLTSLNYGALIGWYDTSWVNIVNCTDTITLEYVEAWDRWGATDAATRADTYAASGTDGNTTVFVGDSFMAPDVWTTFASDIDLYEYDALALGVGGSTAVDWLNYISEGLFMDDIAPANVVFNLGNNDLHWRGYTPAEYAANMQELLTKVHSIMPNAKLYMFSVVERQDAAETVNNANVAPANTLMQTWCAERDWVTYVDIYSASATYRLTTDLLLESDHVHPQLQTYSTIFLPALAAAGLTMNEPKFTEITTQAQLEDLAGQSGVYQLGENITLDGSFTTISGFTGVLLGKGYTISTSTTLFDTLEGATIRNLSIALSGNVSGSGALVNTTSAATITDVHVSGSYTVSGTSYTGGLIGTAKNGTVITNCSNAASVTGTGDSVGGIVGMTTEGQVTINSSTNSGTVSGYRAGGIVGMTYDKLILTGAKNTGTISDGDRSNADTRVGGILGQAESAYATTSMTDCVNEGAVSGGIVGGILGHAANAPVTITGGSNAGTVTGESELGTGGIAGRADGTAVLTVTGATNSGNVTGSEAVGGVLGTLVDGNATATLTDCVNGAAATVTATGTYAGGMVGITTGKDLTISGCQNHGTVDASSGSEGAGGMVGFVERDGSLVTIKSSGNNVTKNTGTVKGNQYAGGMVGMAQWTNVVINITDAVNTGTIQSNKYAGGMVAAYFYGITINITNCSNQGRVLIPTGSDASGAAGGIIGATHSAQGGFPGVQGTVTIKNSTNSGTVSAYQTDGHRRVGGIFGYAYWTNLTVDSCTNTGTVYGPIVGGIVGQHENGTLSLTGCTNEGPVACTYNNYYAWAGGIAGLVNGDYMTSSITGNVNSGFITGQGQVGQIAGSASGTVSDNIELGNSGNYASAVEISSWDEITDSVGTYILTQDVTMTSAKEFYGRLYGTGHTVRTAGTMFGYVTVADGGGFAIEDLNVVLTQSFNGGGVISCWFQTGYRLKNVHLTAENGAIMTGDFTYGNGAFAGVSDDVDFISCTNAISVTSTSEKALGGFVGEIQGAAHTSRFIDCVNYADVASVGYAGGIVGRTIAMATSFTDCVNKGAISSTTEGAGGIVGFVDDPDAIAAMTVTIGSSTNYGTVTGEKYAGGIIGMAQWTGVTVTVENAVNEGTITSNSYAGGIIGCTFFGITVTVKSCTNKAAVSANNAGSMVGGGFDYGGTGPNITVSSATNSGTVTAGGTATDAAVGTTTGCTVTIDNP